MPILPVPLKATRSLADFSGDLESTWSFLCNLSLAIAAVSLGYVLSNSPAQYSSEWWLLMVRIFILFATEFRFYVGHRRYLKSLQDPAWVLPGIVLSEAIRRRAGWDHGLMLMLTVSKILMCAFLNSSVGFVNAFVSLMLCDLLWLRFEPRVRQLPFAWNRSIPPFLPRCWMWINLTTAFLILLGSHAARMPGTNLCLAVTVWHLLVAGTNCLIDLYKTFWDSRRNGTAGGPNFTAAP
jgi:hypothetical protein